MIYANKDVTVKKIERTHTQQIKHAKTSQYTIEFNPDVTILFQSFREVMEQISITTNHHKILFESRSVQTLSQLLTHYKNGLDYATVNAMVVSLAKQLTYLEKNGFSIIHFTLHDIIVVDEIRFLFANSSLIAPFTPANNKLDILQPLKSNKFMSPETLLINELPATLDYRAAYYSLGVLIAYVLLNIDINYAQLDPKLDPIIATPLYYGIKRSVVENPEDRYLLYV
jgi:hypothetical protein